MKKVLILVALLAAGFATASPRIDPALETALAEQPAAQVVILFDLPNAPAIQEAAGRSSRRQAVADRTDTLLSELGDTFRETHRFMLVSALSGQLTPAGLERLRGDDRIVSIGLDVGGRGALDESIPLLGIDQIQAAPPAGLGYDGTGVKVAVLDSGIDATHPDFAGALEAEACFCANSNTGDCCPDGNATQFGTGAAVDDHDHGTWVTGHIMGQGGVAPIGAAPGASLVAVKVLDSNNGFWSSSDITAAYDWLAVNHPDVDVVNASLGTNAAFASQCDSAQSWTIAMSQAVAALTANDAVVIASSGNQGNTNGMAVPSCLGDVIAVGATYKENLMGSYFSCPDVDPQIDEVVCFSNHSPQIDLVAPGVFMTTTQRGGGVSGAVSGTSFASPLVAGCATLIRQAYPDLSAGQVRETMVRSNATATDGRIGQTLPRLNCLNAITLELFEDRFGTAP